MQIVCVCTGPEAVDMGSLEAPVVLNPGIAEPRPENHGASGASYYYQPQVMEAPA
jgi:hypothetical protein